MAVLINQKAQDQFMHHIVLPEWLRDGSRPSYHFGHLDPAKTALLVIDQQVAFVDEGQFAATQKARDIISNVNRLLCSARNSGVAIIFTRQLTSDIPPYRRPDWAEETSMIRKRASAAAP